MTDKDFDRELEDQLERLQPHSLSPDFKERLLGIDQVKEPGSSSLKNAVEMNSNPSFAQMAFRIAICVGLIVSLLLVSWSFWPSEPSTLVQEESKSSSIEEDSKLDSMIPTLVCFQVAIRDGNDLSQLLEVQSETLLPEFTHFRPLISSGLPRFETKFKEPAE